MKRSIARGLRALALIALTLPGCSSPGPQTSSSSHWVACETSDDCNGTEVCERGYCVDATGAPVEVTDGNQAPHAPCDPYVVPEVSLELSAEIIGAGVDPTGIRYVADEVDGTQRVFVSNGDELERKRVLGGGSGTSATGSFDAITFEASDGVKTFVIDTVDGTTQLSIVDGVWRPGDAPPASSIQLEPLDPAVVRTFAVKGWVNPMVDEYFASVETGERLIVLRPEVDWTYEDFRLFLGSSDEVTERPVTSVTRARDGGSTNIAFELEGQEAVAFFPAGGGPGTLTVGSDVKAVQPIDLTVALVMLPSSFQCLLR